MRVKRDERVDEMCKICDYCVENKIEIKSYTYTRNVF